MAAFSGIGRASADAAIRWDDGVDRGYRMEQRLTIVGLGVGDVATALGFYRDGLGWTPSLARSGYFADLDGHPWEIAWVPSLPIEHGVLATDWWRPAG